MPNENFVDTSKTLLKNRNLTFPVVHYFTWKLEFISSKSFGNSWGNFYVPLFIINNNASFHLWSKEIWSNIKKSQNIMTIIYIFRCNHGKNIEINSSFHVKSGTTGKVQFLFFKSLMLVLTKFSFWEEEWALGYSSMEFWDFPNIS